MAKRIRVKRGSRSKNNWQVFAGLIFLSFSIIFMSLILRGDQSALNTPSETIQTKIVAQFDTVQIPVPKDKVLAGTKGKNIHLTMIAYPKHQIPSGALLSLAQVQEASATTDLPANLPLFRNNFSFTKFKSNPVIESIPKGMRAITLRVDVTSAVEGWAGTGASVDMLLVQKEQTIVIAENIKILSSERSVAPVAGDASPDVPTTVTVLVTKEQALAINTAIPRGKIAFALRSLEDNGYWSDKLYKAERLERGNSRGIRKEPKSISGYASIKGSKKDYKFALSDGKWLRTKNIPKGYLGNSVPTIPLTNSGQADAEQENTSLKQVKDK